MKKGDLVRLKGELHSWTEVVGNKYGYLWVVISVPPYDSFIRAKSVATGNKFTFRTKELEKANEEG